MNAVRSESKFGKTFNGADTLVTTGNPCLDFFGAAGNRGVSLGREFDLAYNHDPKLAFRIALWTRDVRGGAGERQTFRNLLKHFETHYESSLIRMLPKIPELGRWDDLLVFESDRVKSEAFKLIAGALQAGNGLTAKWMPRKGAMAVELRRYLGLSPKAYRKTLVNLTKVVESNMCANKWTEIVFDHVPSLASARYQKAFGRHAPSEYGLYKAGLVKVKDDGTTERKINAGAVYPYDVIKSIREGDREVATAQWDALPNFLGDDKILPVVDVSGSMTSWSYYGQRDHVKSNIVPLDISTSIGLYCADKQTGPFAGAFMSFSDKPRIQFLSGNIVNKYLQMCRADWGMNTNIQSAFDEILSLAKRNNVSNEDMPKILLILSDMEFDSCVNVGSSGYKRERVTNFDVAKAKFERAGYTLPKVVFWYLNGRADNNPVSMHESGTAIISGFSPSIFKSILKSDLENYTPESVMLATLNVPRYDVEGLTV